MLGRLKALVLLAWGVLRTLFQRAAGGLNPLAVFESHYGSEGILSVNQEEHEILRVAGRCISCGLCDAGEGKRVSGSLVGYQGIMSFVLSGTRSMPDYDATARTISDIPLEAFEAGERACPVDVPVVDLVKLVRLHAARDTSSI